LPALAAAASPAGERGGVPVRWGFPSRPMSALRLGEYSGGRSFPFMKSAITRSLPLPSPPLPAPPLHRSADSTNLPFPSNRPPVDKRGKARGRPLYPRGAPWIYFRWQSKRHFGWLVYNKRGRTGKQAVLYPLPTPLLLSSRLFNIAIISPKQRATGLLFADPQQLSLQHPSPHYWPIKEVRSVFLFLVSAKIAGKDWKNVIKKNKRKTLAFAAASSALKLGSTQVLFLERLSDH